MKKFFVNNLKFSIFFVFLLNIFIYYFIPINTYASSTVNLSCTQIGTAVSMGLTSIQGVNIVKVSQFSSPQIQFVTPGDSCNGPSFSSINPSTQEIDFYITSVSRSTTYNISIVSIPNTSTQGSPPPAYSTNSACSGVGTSYTNACIACVSQGISPSGSNSQYNYVYTDFGCINTSVKGIINFTYKLVLTIGFMIAFAVIIFAGYLIMMSGGDPEQLNRGKSLLTKAIIGLLVIVFAYAILITIGNLFNISYLK